VTLLQVQVLQAVSEEVQVGGGRVEVVIDRDTQTSEVRLAIRRRKVLGKFPQRLCDAQWILAVAAAVVLTADCPEDGHQYEEGQQDGLDDDQLPLVVCQLLLVLLLLPVLVYHLPEEAEVERSDLGVQHLTF